MPLRSLYSKVQLPNVPPDSIRLLKICEVNGNQLTCHMDQVRLSESPEYSTLSYTWHSPLRKGDGKDDDGCTHVLKFTDGESILVFDNLFRALQRLGYSKFRDQHFWIDAVCIDQENITERSHQVDLMALIYQHAKHVIVWLGPDDEHLEPAATLIKTLPSILRGIPEQDWSKEINAWKIGATDVPSLREQGLQGKSDWVSLAHFFSRSWWSRAWIVQEVLLAKDVKVIAGTEQELSWCHLETVSHFLATSSWRQFFSDRSYLRIAPEEALPEYKTPAFLKAAKRDLASDNGFLYTLIRARRHDCQLSIDKVFSLYSIASACAQDRRKVPDANYNLSPQTAFTQAAKYILESSKDMHILAHSEGQKFHSLPGLPSWVPDWTVTEPSGMGITGYKRYFVTGDPENYSQVPHFPEPHVLCLQASKIACVSSFSESISKVGGGSAAFQTGSIY